MIGARFGKLVVTDLSHSDNGYCWSCRCDCGAVVIRKGTTLRQFLKKGRKFASCGCVKFNDRAMQKTCRTCSKTLSFDEFPKSSVTKHGRGAKCKACARLAWHATTRQRRDQANAKRRAKYVREVATQRARAWRHRNPEKARYMLAIRRARKMSATPPWADKAAILSIYKEAALRGLHVDHIVPLKNSIVCGLHVHYNLQLLDPQENMKKRNLFEGRT